VVATAAVPTAPVSRDVVETTRDYESWVGSLTPLAPGELAIKHATMAEDRFSFFRATFYRWCETWPAVCPALAEAPPVLGVADLHVQNFGTWRDAEGRLVWGVNDFDEAAEVPYTQDLVRLATSAALANGRRRARHVLGDSDFASLCAALLEGYRVSLATGGRPFVLAEDHDWLRALGAASLKDPIRYWMKLDGFPEHQGPLPDGAREAVEAHLPPDVHGRYRVVRRRAGLGSLGRIRLVAIAEHAGGRVAREVKWIVPSAWTWVAGEPRPHRYPDVLARAVRCLDPFVRLHGSWLVRRLAPDCSRIELATLPASHHRQYLLSLGWEVANIHLGSPAAVGDVLTHLRAQPDGWLVRAAADCLEMVRDDHRAWRAAWRAAQPAD
jgi:hypothetical protein